MAEELGIDTVLVPPSAGIISAYGLIASDFTQYFTRTRRAPVGDDAGDVVREVFAEMKADAVEAARAMNLGENLRFEFIADMRFVGQAFEIPVSLPADDLPELTADAVRRRFGEAHHKVYFFGGEASRPIEFVSFRLGLTAPLDALPILEETEASTGASGEIRLFDGGDWRTGRLVARGALSAGERVSGPALLEDPTATVFLPAGWSATRDDHSNTVMTRGN